MSVWPVPCSPTPAATAGEPVRKGVGAFAAGVLCANSLPHLATAVTGHGHLTPLRGRDSAPGVNALWAAMNLAAGLALLRATARGQGRWDVRLVAFDAGAATFAAWMAISESTMRVNWDQGA